MNLKWWDFYTTMHVPGGEGLCHFFVIVCVTHEALYVGNGLIDRL